MQLLIPGAPAAPSPQEQALSPLEQALRGPQAEPARAQALQTLEALEQRLRRSCAQGLPPDDFAQASRLLDACQAARETLTMTFNPPLSAHF